MGVGLSDGFGGRFLTNPEVPEYPAKDGACATPTDNCDRGNVLLVYANERTDEYSYGGNVLDDDSGVCDKRPEIVRT